jgi:hypothetical protein
MPVIDAGKRRPSHLTMRLVQTCAQEHVCAIFGTCAVQAGKLADREVRGSRLAKRQDLQVGG